MASIPKRDRVASEQSTNACSTSSNAASRSPPCQTLTLGPEAEEWEPIETTCATGETTDSHHVQCHKECVYKAGQAAPCAKSVQVDSRLASTLLTTEKAKWKRKERELRSQIPRLQQSDDKDKDELKQLTRGGIFHAYHIGSSLESALRL